MMKQLNGSQIVIECLKEQGVDTVFGYPGGAILNIYDELYKQKDRITHILTSHEQAASHAARRICESNRKGRRMPGYFRTGCNKSGNRNCYRIHGFDTDRCNYL